MPLTQVQNGMLAGVIPASLGGTGTTAGVTGFKNRLINGDMGIWQRGTSFAAPSTMSYTADRWVAVWGSANRTFSRQSGFDSAQYCMRVQRNAGVTDTGYQGLAQIIESVNMYDLRGKTVTFSFTARAGANYSSSGNGLYVYIGTGTVADQGGSVYWSPGWTGAVFNASTIALTTTAQRFSLTTTVPANALEMIVGVQYQASGTAGAADFFEITNVQLEAGAEATNYDVLSIGTELFLCQRYYQVYGGVSYSGIASGMINNTNTKANIANSFSTVMRASPALSFSNLIVTDRTAYDTAVSSVAFAIMSPNGYFVQFNLASTAGGSGTGTLLCVTNGTTGTLVFNAEL